MDKKLEIIDHLTRWFFQKPRSLEMIEDAKKEDFKGVLVYAKTPQSSHWTRRLALTADSWQYERTKVGDKLPFSCQSRGWEKAVCVGKAENLEQALDLMGLMLLE